MKKFYLLLISTVIFGNAYSSPIEKQSAARLWMDGILEAIKQDGLGPTIQSRNLYHLSIAMYDAYAIYTKKSETVLIGKELGGYISSFDGFQVPNNADSALDVTINYAAYRLITSRFNFYSSKTRMMDDIIALGEKQSVDEDFRSLDYKSGSPAALGNYIANQIIEYGLQDGAGDDEGYEADYSPLNLPMKPQNPGPGKLIHKNRWQPLVLTDYVEEKGWDSSLVEWNYLLIPGQDIFLTPHWGNIPPFAMTEDDKKVLKRDGDEFTVYHDPGPPPYISEIKDPENSDAYKWNFILVGIWGSHHDPEDGVLIDISPGAIGSTEKYIPNKYSEYADFFELIDGGCVSDKHALNPYTGKSYKTNIVPRGDYTRVIAEYWVDGVNTYTPPGHWVKMLNQVSDYPGFEKKWNGKGAVLNNLEWDVKSYLTLCGALYDAGIAAWSVKAYYDYIRPISAIRWMASNGQSSDKDQPRYHPEGIPLIDGQIELVRKNDPLVGKNKEHLNKVKILAWKGPEYVDDIKVDKAGVDWILAENWWPYQRYSFATPPFAGYVSGHSTFSSAAALSLELITGDPYFPGGLAEFTAKKNEFLEFEEGPSQDITLQWATYQDACDETCLSRIWGGIHPPADDIPGRKIGKKVAIQSFELSNRYFSGKMK